MSTGISISSINRIKELAEEKRYAEALEILDTQNLDKSINPQFLRISGEIFRENKRYYDSRKILLKAHQMSPQGIRIIYEQIQLYLELGYYTRAKKYYEEYLFYSTSEDTQKDYVEYVMKKASGADIKELAAILIPILERMPEDRWNFEAVLLYDKLGRKDKALEESQHILENFKDSIYVKPVIEYIDDKLDVDQYFNIYPAQEAKEDKEIFGDLIAEDDKLLEEDHLRMYPPEARIMVEAEDKDAIEVKPAKEKKSKKKKKRKNVEEATDEKTAQSEEEKSESKESDNLVQEALKISKELGIEGEAVSDTDHATQEESEQAKEEQIKQEREAALEKLLSKKIDKEKIRESARQVAKAMKDIDTTKAKSQMLSVAESVKDNVKKATDVLGEAVGAKTVFEEPQQIIKENASKDEQEQILDGIIESVLEPPKKVIGEVLMNEELDALIPDSLEAMSAEEIADIEAKKKENERLELEALEASMKLEEEKKKAKSKKEEQTDDIEESVNETEQETVIDASALQVSHKEDSLGAVSYEELKARFLAELNVEAEPLDSLGFISVVQSDIDDKMEEEIPDAAEMLHQMIDNKEFYSGEDSTRFESKASYDNHGFEVENYDFESYMEDGKSDLRHEDLSEDTEESIETVQSVQVIYAEETIVDFDEIVPEKTPEFFEPESEKISEVQEEKPVSEEPKETYQEETVSESQEAESIIEISEKVPEMRLPEEEPTEVLEIGSTEEKPEKLPEMELPEENQLESQETELMEKELPEVLVTEEAVEGLQETYQKEPMEEAVSESQEAETIIGISEKVPEMRLPEEGPTEVLEIESTEEKPEKLPKMELPEENQSESQETESMEKELPEVLVTEEVVEGLQETYQKELIEEAVSESQEAETIIEKSEKVPEMRLPEEELIEVLEIGSNEEIPEMELIKENQSETSETELLVEKTVGDLDADSLTEGMPEILETDETAEGPPEIIEEKLIGEDFAEVLNTGLVEEESLEIPESEILLLDEEPIIEIVEEGLFAEELMEATDELEENVISLQEQYIEKADLRNDRENLRIRILLSDNMVRKLLDLKESR
ncbi:MAG: hypothetical protein K2J90_14890 [Lachnospiraceae bacterium]|nr:hypothetical protein [Lachnospiraceae bacterium]